MAYQFYAVTVGRLKGIFDDYEDVMSSISELSGGKQKGFRRKDEAVAYYKSICKSEPDDYCNKDKGYVTKIEKVKAKLYRPADSHQDIIAEKYIVYTDGSCIRNPNGPGGWAYTIKDINGNLIKELYKGYKATTNNRMELKAIWGAIYHIDQMIHSQKNSTKARIKVVTDSKYCQSIFTKWIKKWMINGFKTKDGEVKNRDIIERLYALISKHDVDFEWVKGHSGHPDNERCDLLATNAAKYEATNDDTVG